MRLQATGEQQDDDDDQEDAETAAWVVTPTRAMGPCRKRAYQHKDQDDEQDRGDTHVSHPR